MSVANSIAPQQQQVQKQLDDARIAEFKVGDETIKLSAAIVRTYLVRGRAHLVTDAEIALYINLCKYRHLNPWAGDAFLIKYSEKSPATIVVSKDAKLKRAKSAPEYAGHQAGVIVLMQNGELQQRPGALVLRGEQLVGGWAKVYVRGYEVPIEVWSSFQEYYLGTNPNWDSKPATMIRKVALSQALTEAFPHDLSGMYDAEEAKVDPEVLDEAPPIPPEEAVKPEPIPEPMQVDDFPQHIPVTTEEPIPVDMPEPEQMEMADLPTF